jgi:hypothetical protein
VTLCFRVLPKEPAISRNINSFPSPCCFLSFSSLALGSLAQWRSIGDIYGFNKLRLPVRISEVAVRVDFPQLQYHESSLDGLL